MQNKKKSQSDSAILNEYSLPLHELRIGNVIRDQGGKWFTLSPNTFQEVLKDPNQFAPVKLTEEILTAQPYTRSGIYRFDLDMLEDYYLMFTGKFGILYKVDKGTVGVPIHYLHQLQNNWFYIVGKELEITFGEVKN